MNTNHQNKIFKSKEKTKSQQKHVQELSLSSNSPELNSINNNVACDNTTSAFENKVRELEPSNKKSFVSDHFEGKKIQERSQEAELKDEKSNLVKFFGLSLIFMTIISLLFVGLIINCFQFILLISSNFSSNIKWKRLHKYLNGHLVYIMFSPPICLLYYWNKLELDMKVSDIKHLEYIEKPVIGIVVPNHSYELDYMICFALADQLGDIGSYKTLSKDQLKYIPIAGWSLWMSDIIFVKREWSKDRLIIKSKLEESFNYEQLLLSVFAEGTRWTKEKHEISKKYSLKKGLKPLKYHLEPRPRGFSYIVRYYLKEICINKRRDLNLFRIYNLQMMMPPVRFIDFVYGTKIRANVYCEPVEISEEFCHQVINSSNVDDDNDDGDVCPLLEDLLRKIYERKDEIVEQYYKNNNQFVVDKCAADFPFKTKITPLIIWLIGFVFTYSVFGYLALTVYSRSITFWSIVLSYVTACAYTLIRISNESKANNNVINKKNNSIHSKDVKANENSENNNGDYDDDEKDFILLSNSGKEDNKKIKDEDHLHNRMKRNNRIIIDDMSPC